MSTKSPRNSSAENSVLVVGAGIAGLVAGTRLAEAGLPVTILEARERIGGRMLTHHDPASPVPIELGAEFIHGMAPEILEPLQEMNAAIVEVEGDSWCVSRGRLSECNFFGQVDGILAKMDASEPDESFLEFLERRFPNKRNDPELEEARRHAVGYVTGFNAADPGKVGVHWLIQGMEAEERIQGQRAFRAVDGYGGLVEFFRRKLEERGGRILTKMVVEKVEWQRGRARVAAREGTNGIARLEVAKILITLPLGVLKASTKETGAVKFLPGLPRQKTDAMERLEMGKVMRVVLRFRNRFWETIAAPGGGGKTLGRMSFLFSDDEWFPTWWTAEPRKSPMITGWAPFRAGEELSKKSEGAVIDQCLNSLGRVLNVSAAKLREEFAGAYFHNWQNDPFSRGAYSYAKVGSDGAQEALGSPVENTLFFAGEATDTTGNNGTVHGAIASGLRAAEEILRKQ